MLAKPFLLTIETVYGTTLSNLKLKQFSRHYKFKVENGFIAFRLPKGGEVYLSRSGFVGEGGGGIRTPYIILEDI